MKQHIPDALAVVALSLIVAGVALWSIPAALIVAGIGIGAIAYQAARLESAK